MTRLTAEERADKCQQSCRTWHEELARVKVSEHLEIHTFLSSRWIVKLGVLAKNIIQCRTKQFLLLKNLLHGKGNGVWLDVADQNAFVQTEPLHCAKVKLDSWTHQVIVIFVESYIYIYIFYDNKLGLSYAQLMLRWWSLWRLLLNAIANFLLNLCIGLVEEIQKWIWQ